MSNEEDIPVLVEGVTIDELRSWVSERWIRPTTIESVLKFGHADVARIRLLQALIHQMDVDVGAIPVILSLIDQVHSMRSQMRCLAEAINAHPGDIGDELIKLVRLSQ